MKSLLFYILQISIWSVMIPLFTGVIFFKKLTIQSRLIFYLVVLATLPQILTAFIEQKKLLNSIYNVYTILEFFLLYFFIGYKISARGLKKICLVFVCSFFIVIFITIINAGITIRFFNEWVCLSGISYLCWIFLYLLECIYKEVNLLDSQNPMFWYLSGLLLYIPCTILVFSLYYYIGKSHNPFIKNLWTIHGVFNTILYLFFAVGFYKDERQGLINEVAKKHEIRTT